MSLLRSYDLWSYSFTGAIAPAYNHCQSYGLPWLLTLSGIWVKRAMREIDCVEAQTSLALHRCFGFANPKQLFLYLHSTTVPLVLFNNCISIEAMISLRSSSINLFFAKCLE